MGGRAGTRFRALESYENSRTVLPGIPLARLWIHTGSGGFSREADFSHSSLRRVMTPAVLRESPGPGSVPHLRLGAWGERWPWLVQGITTRGPGEEWDLALFGEGSTGAVLGRWEELLEKLRVREAVHARQVHGAGIRAHPAGMAGLRVAPACDGHVTDRADLLLTVSVADCVPVYLVSEAPRAVGVVHAGWRGAAAGILEGALARMEAEYGVAPEGVHIHLGPSICGGCYEVGPEVHEALGEPVPQGPTPVDLRRNLARRAAAAGIPEASISVSDHCTRCGDAGLFSHRGGSRMRQMAFIGIREGA